MTARRYYRRNLISLGCERAANYIFVALRHNACGGLQSVFVDDNGGITLYRPSHPKYPASRSSHLVGTYGATVNLGHLREDLKFRLDELSGSTHNLRHNRKQD
jgi:hypothetical protein